MNKWGNRFFGNGVVGRDLVHGAEGPVEVFLMKIDGRRVGGVEFGEGADVIGVRVGQQIGGDGESIFFQHRFNKIGIIAVVDDQRLLGVTPNNRAVYFVRSNGNLFKFHARENR